MNLSTTGRLIVSVLTLLTFLVIVVGIVYGFIVHWPAILMVTGFVLLPAFGFFIYNDYLHYFKNGS